MNETSHPEPAPQEQFLRPPFGLVEEIDLAEILRKIKRRKGVLFGTVMILTMLTVIVLFQLVPRYTTETLILVENRQNNVVDMEAVLAGLSGDVATVLSEIEVILSRRLAAKVVDHLKLDRNPEFNASLRPPGLMAEIFDLKSLFPESWREYFPGMTAPEELSEEETASRERVRIVDAFLENLEVSPKGRSRVILVQFTSEDPKTAAQVANTIADFYILEQLEAKFEATQKANSWLNERVAKLRKKVEETERAVEVYRKKFGLVGSKGVTLSSQQLVELSTQLILAKTTRAEAEARLRQIKNLVDAKGGFDSVVEVLDSRLIQRLREQEAEVERKAAELSTEYGERHPKMINTRAEMRDINSKIRREVNKIVKGLENEAGIARARHNSLQKSVNQLRNRVAKANTAEVKLRAFEREANANRTLLDTFLARFKETSTQVDIATQKADARIISFADVPALPSFPKKKLILALAFVGSIFVGFFLIFLIEHLDHGFRSGEQIEQMIGAPILGLVPLLSGWKKLGRDPEAYFLKHPGSAFGESIRTLYTGILLSHVDAPPKLVLLTSSLPNEGKTSLTLSLARLQSQAGHKVLIVDADLRRPGVSERLLLNKKPGLVQVLTGEISLDEALQEDNQTGAHVLVSGGPAPNPPDILGSEQMKRLLTTVSKVYDLVIIDSPPVLAVSDARILSTKVDATVFVVRWASTRREVVTTAIKQLSAAGGRLAGVVLSLVDAKKHAGYGYGDSGYYTGTIKKYYTG